MKLLAASLVLAFATAACTTVAPFHAAPVRIERAAPATSVPLEMRFDKLFLEAEVNGEPREFIFDTGSPTILTRKFADALGLEITGRNTGVDANGNRVEMDVAVASTIAIGRTVFRNVPVMIFDYATLDMGSCLMDGGVLGSELLPGSAWRIDVENKRLTIAERASALPGSPPAVRTRLHDLGYPHYPIVDYRIGTVADKALFDTGNQEQVTLYEKVAGDRSVEAAYVPGSVDSGRGYEGESAGGWGAIKDLTRITIADLRLGDQSLRDVQATFRGVPPTLLGAGLLSSHTVTLDYPGAQFLLEARQHPEQGRPDLGFAISLVGEHATVVRIFDQSPAHLAGLRLGDRVIELQGKPLAITPETQRCDLVRRLAQPLDPAKSVELVVLRDSRPVKTVVPAAAPD